MVNRLREHKTKTNTQKILVNKMRKKSYISTVEIKKKQPNDYVNFPINGIEHIHALSTELCIARYLP